MNRKLLITGVVFGLIAILLGAFAAHGLEKVVDSKSIIAFKTGVRYQIYHAFLLLFLSNTNIIGVKVKLRLLIIIIFGIMLFSGSIYALAINSLVSFDFKTIAFITPIGGLVLIFAWLMLLISAIKSKTE